MLVHGRYVIIYEFRAVDNVVEVLAASDGARNLGRLL
jgi:hypothetical protein